MLVLFAFLRQLRSTAGRSALSIPVSVFATFIIMYRLGLSLNLMSLGGLALAVGMLVDDSIVVLESIFRKREEGDWRRARPRAQGTRDRRDGGDRVDAHHGRGVLPAGVRARGSPAS